MASVRTAERASNRTTCPALTWTPFHSGRPSHAELDLLDPIATLACAARGNTGAHVEGICDLDEFARWPTATMFEFSSGLSSTGRRTRVCSTS